ncbi:MAG: bifunctional precorrin-2 dehydrogenase/sirohydrochlorin ferrochelatase [Candidatus Methylomirabilia bacterium]
MADSTYFPVFVEMRERPCLVVGGGRVAERKVKGLLGVGARVTLVSPILTERLASWARDGRLHHVPRAYRAEDLDGHEIAFVAVDGREVNAAVARDGRARGIWVNVADDPARSDFILPSVLRRGKLVVAVGTGGASPALARAIREELDAYFTEDYARLAELVAGVRRELRQRAGSLDGEVWNRVLGPHLRRLIAEGKREEAKSYLLEGLGAARCR